MYLFFNSPVNHNTLKMIVRGLPYSAPIRLYFSFNLYLEPILCTGMEDLWLAETGMSEQDYRLLEVAVLRGVPHKAGHQWKFAGAFYYATNVLTTIG